MKKLFSILFYFISLNTSAQIKCDNWLYTPSRYSYVDIGNLNITGDKITVEAVFNRTQPYVAGGGDGTEGDLVSKHDNPTDVNYLLRPNEGSITTSNGFFTTPIVSTASLNKTYHVAMVYDGDTLKFYRDGCLISKVAASGYLYQNSWNTRIGYYQNQIWNTNFIGFINEVRIWNVARTQAQIQAYMNTSLPNPPAQPGLLAYYTFDNLINKQGNASWNGSLNGSASINQTNTSCNPIVNLCNVVNCNMIVTRSSDTTVCKGSSVNLFATGGTTYTWTPQSGLDNPDSSNPVASPSVSTKYYVTIDDATGCSKTDSVQIIINNLPVVTKSNDTSICTNSTASLFATGGTSYSWSPGTGLDNSSISNPKANPSATTKYYVTVMNSVGCSKEDSVKVTVNALPVISKSNDTAICNKSSVKLFTSGGSSYSWTPAGSLNNPAIADPVASPVSSTTYFITVTNGACSAMDSIRIDVNPVAKISTSNDTTVCNNSSTKIFASGGTSYQWSPASFLDNAASANPVASPTSTTVFHVSITDSYSCVYRDSVKISVREPRAFSISPDNSVCANTSRQLNAYGGDSYEWSPSTSLNDPLISDPVATPDSTITYSVIIKDTTCSQTDTLSTRITVLRLPDIIATHANDIDCSFSSSKLNASGGNSYTWTPASSLDNSGSANPIAFPTATTVYTVTGKNEDGCSNSDTVTVKVDFNGKMIFGLPNAFTPNGDGLNDCFGVEPWGRLSQLDFSIYNRWGQRIFHTSDPHSCWDGNYNGNPEQAGVFVYMIKAKTACGNIDKKGTVTLVR